MYIIAPGRAVTIKGCVMGEGDEMFPGHVAEDTFKNLINRGVIIHVGKKPKKEKIGYEKIEVRIKVNECKTAALDKIHEHAAKAKLLEPGKSPLYFGAAAETGKKDLFDGNHI